MQLQLVRKGQLTRFRRKLVDLVEDKLSSLSTDKDASPVAQQAVDVDMSDSTSVMAVEAITQQVLQRDQAASSGLGRMMADDGKHESAKISDAMPGQGMKSP